MSETLKTHKASILIPVYNSETTVALLVDRIIDTLSEEVLLKEIILVNDGSSDGSHDIIEDICKKYPDIIKYIQLFRNFGEHNAVMCGLNYVTGDSVTILDDDFQNPPSEILVLLKKLQENYDVVYSYYDDKRHSRLRNLGSKFNDVVATVLLGKPRGLYLSSFKTISAPLVRVIAQYQGPYPYVDGLILRSTSRIGRQVCQHSDRMEGQSSYTLTKLARLWLNMFTGFSLLPLRITSYLGIVVSLMALLMTVYFVIIRFTGPIFYFQDIPPGWASTIVAITFLAGLQLIMLGMIGEYLGRVFLTMNGTPQFLIRHTNGVEPENSRE